MTVLAILGAALTLISLGLVLLGGYLLALRLLPAEDREDDLLALAVAALLCATAEAVGIALLLGATGHLYLPWALLLQALLVAALLRWPRRLAGADLRRPLELVLSRAAGRLRDHPALAIVTLSALAAEALRGLLRPPLSWDALMYHLLLAASWLQGGNLQPVFGYYPVNYFGFVPANGSLWLWWWLAPSHSEIFANLAFLPQVALLGLAAGGIARHLGAHRHWPVASWLALLTPTVVRYAATEYVDVFLASALLAACFFGWRWLREPRAGSAALAGLGLGIASGAKVLGVPYAALLAATLLLLAPGMRRRRLPQALLACALAIALGSYFYLRNIHLGAGPLALSCADAPNSRPEPVAGGVVPLLPRPPSLLGSQAPPDAAWQAFDAFLGTTRPYSLELGIGPPFVLLLAVAVVLPLALPRSRRREGWVVAILVASEVAFWFTVPSAQNREVYANVRYLVPAICLLFAGGVALAESRALSARVIGGIALLVAAQDLLQLHAEMSHGVRLAIAVADLAAVALGLSPGLRGLLRRRWRAFAGVGVAALLAAAAPLAAFRAADRSRALAHEWVGHATDAHLFAGAWGWLDRHGGNGTVAISSAPALYFVYPAMGPYFERQVRYVNVNRADFDSVLRYPRCEPRVDASAWAWFANLQRARVRWLLVTRYPGVPFPVEQQWASAAPSRFAPRYADNTTLVYEVLPGEVLPGAPPALAPAAAPAAATSRGR
jgi:hypothetical protein